MPQSLFSYVPMLKVNIACKNEATLFHISLIKTMRNRTTIIYAKGNNDTLHFCKGKQLIHRNLLSLVQMQVSFPILDFEAHAPHHEF